MKKFFKAIGVLVVAVVVVSATYVVWQYKMIQDLRRAHIEANQPSADNFDRFMKRDLEDFALKTFGNESSVSYEYLRQGPTQSGISYPKYYVWLSITRPNQPTISGAARVGAMEQTKFFVTHFIQSEDIRKDGAEIRSTFPGPVCEKILEKVGRN